MHWIMQSEYVRTLALYPLEFSEDELTRMREESLERIRRDGQSRLDWALERGKNEQAIQTGKIALKDKLPMEKIILYPGLSGEEILKISGDCPDQ